MKRKVIKLFYLFFIISASGEIFAQSSKAMLLYSPDNMPIQAWSRENVEVLDTTFLALTYRMRYVLDTASEITRTNTMRLQIGRKWSRYYSLIRNAMDIRADRISKQNGTFGSLKVRPSTKEEQEQLRSAGDVNMNGEIWIDIRNSLLIDRYHSLSKYNESIEYREPIPDFNWKLSSDTMNICGYVCHKAETKFRGRSWIVWYSTQIPVNSGPWKFGGLPGLVLYAEDAEGQYFIECIEISQQKEPIIFYVTENIVMSRAKCIRYFRNAHERPLEVLGNGAELRVYSQGKLLDATWSIPYNPIELE